MPSARLSSKSARLITDERGPLIQPQAPQTVPATRDTVRRTGTGKQRGPLVDYQPQPAKVWTVDGWTGMYDSRADTLKPDEATLLINLIPSDPVRGGPAYLRPGRVPLANAATAPRLGGGAHLVQWMGEAQLNQGGVSSGPENYAIADGEIYLVETGSGALTKVVSTANFATAGITMSTAVVCLVTVFHGTLVVANFNANAPFTWDGSTGAGGLVKLTNAPVGPWDVTVYYAKLFFLKSDQKTIVWSEELQANTGYEAGGYNNAWELTQTSNEPLTTILGTNEGLYYGRATSVGAIRGAVSSTFSTDGVHDSVHIGSGPTGPQRFAYCWGSLFWGDSTGQLFAYRPGSGVVELTGQMSRVFGYPSTQNLAGSTRTLPVYGVGEDNLANATLVLLVPDPSNQRIYAEYAGTTSGRWVHVYDGISLRLLCLWSFGTANDNLSNRYACMGRLATVSILYLFADDQGYVFQQQVGGNASVPPTADKSETGAATAVVGTLMGSMHGWSPTIEWQFEQLDVLTDELPTNAVSVGYLTSRSHKASLTPADQTDVSSGVLNTPFERHRAFGLGKDASGRWLRPIIQITGSTATAAGSEPPQIFGYSLTGRPVSTSPAVL